MEQLVAKAISSIKEVMKRFQVSVAWSGGKDSSVVLGLVMQAAVGMSKDGAAMRKILITHGDTTVENPEIHHYAQEEIHRIRRYAKEHDIPLDVLVARPALSESWQCRVIGGRALPSFPGTNHDCTTDMKIQPMNRLRKGFADQGPSSIVTIIGTRFEESPQRAQRMRERGEAPETPWVGDDGSLYLSPIALWGMEDVWEYLGYCRSGHEDYLTFSKFDDVFRIYADAAGSSCAVVGDLATKGQSKPCGARTGCWCCTPIGRDKSLETMIETDPRYGYMRGLNRLQRFLVNTRWDLSRRNWLGRTVDSAGYVAIGPDVYSPLMLKQLLRYCLTLDAVEGEVARTSGFAPRFRIINDKTLLAIDAMWNLQGYHKPFEALRVFKDVVEHGNRYPVPDVMEFPKTTIPKTRWLHVGIDWADDTRLIGLRDPIAEAISEDSYCMGTRATRDGRTVMDVNTSVAFDMDDDGVNDFFTFEFDRILDEADEGRRFGPTGGYMYYARMGILSLAPQVVSTVDAILRRTWWKHEQGYFGQIDPQVLIDRSIQNKPENVSRGAPDRIHIPSAEEVSRPEQLDLLKGILLAA